MFLLGGWCLQTVQLPMSVPEWRQVLGCRPAMGKHEGLKRVMAEAPDFALRLMQDLLKQ